MSYDPQLHETDSPNSDRIEMSTAKRIDPPIKEAYIGRQALLGKKKKRQKIIQGRFSAVVVLGVDHDDKHARARADLHSHPATALI